MPYAAAIDDTIVLDAVTAVFRAFGQTIFFLDRDFRVLRDGASPVVGFPPDELRQILRRGETREGWRIAVAEDGGPRMMAVSAAPLNGEPLGSSARYVVILRPATDFPPGTTHFFTMVGRSDALMKIFAVVQGIATSESPVLLIGEPGSGRESLARAIHACSPRRRGRFVTVDCGALPMDLLEAEIFGNGRAAIRTRGGTMFLREVDQMPPAIRTKLARALHEPFEVRVIASSTMEPHFEKELVETLSATTIRVPPLRARREDIEPIAQSLLGRAATRQGRELRFATDALRAMLNYGWPENARELETAVEYAVAVTRGGSIHADDLPSDVSNVVDRPQTTDGDEAAAIRAMLDAHHWNRETTAAALGISRTTLWRKMRELGVR